MLIRSDEKTLSRMRNILLAPGGKLQLTVFPEEEGIVSEKYRGKREASGRNRNINDCGLGGKNGNLLNILNTREAGRSREVEYCITSVSTEYKSSGNKVGKLLQPKTTHRQQEQ